MGSSVSDAWLSRELMFWQHNDKVHIETRIAQVETGTAQVETGTAQVETGTAQVETGTAQVEMGTAQVRTEAEMTYKVEMPEVVMAQRKEVEEIIENFMNEIEKNNKTLDGWKRLSAEKKLSIIKQCEKLKAEYYRFDYSPHRAREYEMKIKNQFLTSLSLTIGIKELKKELSEVSFYHALRSEKLDRYFPREFWQLISVNNCRWSYERYEILRKILGEDDDTLRQFYNRLRKNRYNLLYFIYSHPQLLFDCRGGGVLDSLMKYLSGDDLRHFINNSRDSEGRTCLFEWLGCYSYNELYSDHVDELYKLLSIRDKHGQTARPVPAICMSIPLIATYVPKYRTELLKLLFSIKNRDNQTALDTGDEFSKSFSWISDQVENNRYLLGGFIGTQVLIICNTRNREDNARQEAESIYNAFKQTDRIGPHQTDLKNDLKKDSIIRQIEFAAKTARSALIVVYLSHGNVGVVEDYDGDHISLKSIEAAMCVNNKLNMRPKILITQCCQHRDDGTELFNIPAANLSEYDKAGPPKSAEREPFSPVNDHFCAIMSSVQGEISKRNYFIPKLAKEIEKKEENVSLLTLVERVKQQMEAEGSKQTPIIQSTLVGTVCLANEVPIVFLDKHCIQECIQERYNLHAVSD